MEFILQYRSLQSLFQAFPTLMVPM